MTRKYINEHYFDQPSRENNYTLGAFVSRVQLFPEVQGFLIKSKNRDLIQIIDRELGLEYLGSREPSGYFLRVRNVPHMFSRLEQLGLGVPRSQREFPNIEEKYLEHFIRGFLDAQANVNQVKGTQLTNVEIYFNHQFLLVFYQKLQEYADITRGKPFGIRMVLRHSDSVKVYHFIYREWDFIKKSGLYLPSKKNSYTPDYQLYSSFPKIPEKKRRIEIAKQLLLDGQMPTMFYRELGYSHLTSFYRAFKEVTGFSPTEWLFDVRSPSIYKEFEDITNLSAEEWLAAQRAKGWKEIDF